MVNDKVNDVVNVMVNRLKGFRHEIRLLKFRLSALYLTRLRESFVHRRGDWQFPMAGKSGTV